MKTQPVGPFDGVITALDPRGLPFTGAQGALNVRIDDRRLAVRYGFKNLVAIQSNFSAFNGGNYVQGYSGSTEKEEYITFEKYSGFVRAHSRGTGTTPTEIKNGVTSVNLHDSDWLAVGFEANGYFINPNSSNIYRHVLNDATSLTAIAAPANPTTNLTYRISYPSPTTGFTMRSWTGVLTADVTYTGIGTSTGFAVNSDGSITLGMSSGSSAGAASFEIDMEAHLGNQDWTNNDVFGFTLQGEPGAGVNPWSIAPTSVVLTFTNDDGSPDAFVSANVTCTVVASQVGSQRSIYYIRAEFDKTGVRADWDNIKKVKVAFDVTANSGAKVRMSPWTLGGVRMRPPGSRAANQDGLIIGYSYIAGSFESGIAGDIFIPHAETDGVPPYPGIEGLGTHVELTATVSGDSAVTDFGFYTFDVVDQIWRRAGTQSDGDTTYDYRITYKELHLLTEYSNITPFKTDGCMNAFSHRGSLVWLYNTGISNIRYSRVGDPEKQESTLDQDDDLSRGETFTLADNLGDVPLGGISAGATVLIAGSLGIYSQLGEFPSQMSPTKKVSNLGAANKFGLCKFTDDSGNPGMAYISPYGQVCFVPVNPGFAGDDGGKPIILSQAIETGSFSPQSFLRDGQSLSDFSTARLGVDETTGTLWVVMGKRALKFCKNAQGKRYWSPLEHNITGTWKYLMFSSKRRMRAVRSTGELDEFEWNTATGAFIVGANRDAGSPVPTPYWHSRTFRYDKVQRVVGIRIVRSSNVDRPYIMVLSDRTPNGNLYQPETGKQGLRTGITNTGRDLSFKLFPPESDGTYSAIEADLSTVDRPHA